MNAKEVNAYQKFLASIIVAVFDADREPQTVKHAAAYLRNFADFLEQNGEGRAPSSFGSYEAFRGAYAQWNFMRESAISAGAPDTYTGAHGTPASRG